MNIPDGEYDIDLLVFETSQEPLVALRYGFIPDSMDQSKPLTLFMTDQTCVLEAPLMEKAGIKLLPIIFEGLPQRQRPAANGILDSYFLTVGEGKATLRLLLSTVRVNKSRNAEKLRGNIAEWRVNATETQKNGGLALPVVSSSTLRLALLLPPDVSHDTAPSKTSLRPHVLKNLPGHAQQPKLQAQTRKEESAQEGGMKDRVAKSNSPLDPVATLLRSSDEIGKQRAAALQIDRAKLRESVFRNSDRRGKKAGAGARKGALLGAPVMPKPASKRPPTSPETKLDIISASDFEDLEADEVVAEEKSRPRALNNDMEDDFKDLEDQLQEVLEDPNMSDSDDSEFAPIVIQVSDDNPKRSGEVSQRDTTQKPMSLRELYGGGRNDDLSSSEEE